MFSNLKQWISLDSIFDQEEDRRMARILLTMILAYWAGSLVVLFMDLTWGDSSLTTFLIAGSIMQLIPLEMLRRGKLSASSYATIVIYLGFTTLFATVGLGIRDYVIVTYPAIIMFSGLTNQRRGLILSLVLTIISLAWLVFGEMYGWFIIQKVHVPNIWDFIVACLIIILAAIAVHLLVSNLEHGLAQTWRELAKRQRVEESLRETKEDFQRYFNMGSVGMAVTTPEKVWIEVNDRLCQIFGYPKDELTKMTWAELTHPDDLDANLKLFNQMMAGEIDSFQMDKRYIRKDKSVVYTSLFASCHRNPDGTVNHLLTSIIDITERKLAEEALNKSETMYRLLAENVSDVIWILDLNTGKFRYVSPSVERLRGYTAEEVMAQDMAATVHSTSLPLSQQKISLRVQSYEDGYRGFYVDKMEQLCKDGSTVWVEITSNFRMNEANGHLESFGVSRDITERKHNEKLLEEANRKLRSQVMEIEQLQEELREQAIRDPLTGLYNRRYMQDVFKQEFSRALRENYPVSVIMLDMDELKVVNDTFGHHVGDMALKTIALQIQSMTRKEDIVCRYGGDEFTVILSKTFPKDAVKRVEEWRESLDNHPLEVEGKENAYIKFTAGIASFPLHGASMEEILNYADVALYRAKARGRNCTSIFE